MQSQRPAAHQSDMTPSAPLHRLNVKKLIGPLALILVLGLAFAGYLTPDMRIQWANLMTLCGF